MLRINEDLPVIADSAYHNKLIVNPTKSQAIAVYRYSSCDCFQPLFLNGLQIPYSSKVKSLVGFWLDELLSLDHHVSSIIRKV